MVLPICKAFAYLAPEATHYITENILPPIGAVATKTFDNIAPPRSHRRFISAKILNPTSFICVHLLLFTKIGSYIPPFLDEESWYATPVDLVKGTSAFILACSVSDLYWGCYTEWEKSQPAPSTSKKD